MNHNGTNRAGSNSSQKNRNLGTRLKSGLKREPNTKSHYLTLPQRGTINLQPSESVDKQRDQMIEMSDSKKSIGSKPNTAVPTQRYSESDKKATPNSKAMIPSKGAKYKKPEPLKQPNSTKKPTDSGEELVFKPMRNGNNGTHLN